ncbi:amidohydrolase [Amycolatopsis antarctica]|uniref:Amidohydrolase n=1 Tax=Amycolatopsis antarctica TaxID=1854586 RepID=A0A263D4F1_9PSEU|nr:amidohydrolase family protein [Amycolatopsis antarctica]OZM73069.1 amidohydrolase [Amycolatopsis antarctica]
MELVISAGSVLTAPGAERIPGGAVHVRDGVVAAVGTRDEVDAAVEASVPRADYPDATILPGLIDAHVHLAFDAGTEVAATVRESDDACLMLGMTGRARALLDTGVTTVRDLGDRGGLAARLRDAIASGGVPGPRILAAGAPITITGGHCWFLGGEVDGSEESIRDMVRRNVAAGADLVKVMATGGGLTPGGPAAWESQFDGAALRIVTEEARRAGLRTAAHAHGAEGIAAAVAAGVDTIEHCTWMTEGGFEVREDVVAEIVANGVFVCPGASPGWRALPAVFGEERAAQMFGRVRWMADQGVRLIAGTDAGVPRAVFDDFPGSLEFFEHLGLPPARVLTMATTDAAAALGLAGETGTVAPGYRADLLVADGDPEADLAALRALRLVLAGGRPHVPAGAAVPARPGH